MSDSNRVQLTHVRETTLGTTPTTPRMRRVRLTGESLAFKPVFEQSEEIREDRMNSDPIKVNETHDGGVNGELYFPPDNSPFSDWLESLFCNEWSNLPVRDNDGAADSVITDVAATGGVITCLTGDAFVVGHLVRLAGFTESGNVGLFKLTTGSATVPAVGSSLLTDEAAPPAAARVKVVGFEGADADITATATGLASTVLDFTTLGLVVGQWIKAGATGTAYRFATEANNAWARITAITANALTLDNLPSGWSTDAGTGKTIRVFAGDQLKNGTLTLGQTLERGFLDQTTPTYINDKGMVVGQGDFDFPFDNKSTWAFSFQGLTGGISTTTLDAAPDDRVSNAVMAAGVNAGRIAENGAIVSGPNFVQSMKVTVQNNLRVKGAIRGDGNLGGVDIGKGSCDVTLSLTTYFGSDALLNKFFLGTPTNVNSRITKNNQALVFAVPRMTFDDGLPNAGGKNQDVMTNFSAMASADSVTSAHIILDRMEYFEV